MKKVGFNKKQSGTTGTLDPSVIAQIEGSVQLAEQARDEAISAKDAALSVTDTVYATESEGRGSVLDGEYFRVAGDGVETVTKLYKRIDNSNSTLVGDEPSADFVKSATQNVKNAGVSLAYELPLIKSSLIGGRDLLNNNFHRTQQLLVETLNPTLNSLGFNKVFSGNVARIYNTYGENAGFLDHIIGKPFIYSYLVIDEGMSLGDSSSIISYKSPSGDIYLRKRDAINLGEIQLEDSVKLRWFQFNPIPDIDTTSIMDFRTGVTGELTINPSVFTFNPKGTPHIEACDYLSYTDKKPVYGMSDLSRIFDKIDLLERQNSALKDWSEGKNFTKLSMGIGNTQPWSAYRIYNDLMKESDSVWELNSAPYTNLSNKGWPLQIPDGSRLAKFIMIRVFAPYKVRTGKYVVTWSGPLDLYIRSRSTVNANGTRVSANRFEIELLQAPSRDVDPATEQMILHVENNTGSPQDLTDVKIFHIDDEVAVTEGKLFNQGWLDYHKNTPVVRFMDLLRTNNSELVEFSEYPEEDYCSYSGNGSTVLKSIPPSVVGKLGTELKSDIWVNIPHKASLDCIDKFAKAIYDNYPEGNVYVEYSNETWNGTFKVNRYLGDNTTDFTGDYLERVAQGTAKGSCICWEAFENYFPRNRIKRVISGQFIGFGNAKKMFDYNHNGTQVKDLVDLYAVAPYMSISGGVGIVTDVDEQSLKENKRWLEPLSWWQEGFDNDLNSIDTRLQYQTSELAKINPNIRMTTYEIGHHLMVERKYDYTFSVDKVNSVLNITSHSSVDGIFDDGDQVEFAWKPTGTEVHDGTDHYNPKYVKKISTTGLKLYATEADYLADNPVTFNPNAVDTQTSSNYTRQIALGEFYHSIVSSEFMVALYEKLINIVRKNKIEQFNQFVDLGGWVTGNLNFSWGLARDLYDNNVRKQYYSGLQKKYYPDGMPPYVPES